MELQVGVKAFIKNDANQYLILRRQYPYQGEDFLRWDIPGGRINPGEPILKALAREITEETGLTLLGDPRILHAQDILRLNDIHVVRLTFECQATTGEIKLDTHDQDSGHDKYQWATLSEIKQLPHDKYLDSVLTIMGV